MEGAAAVVAVRVVVGAAVEDEGRQKVPSTRISDQADHKEAVRITQSILLLAALGLAAVEEDEDWEKMVILYC